MLRNSEESWGSVARSLHWLLALLIFGQFALGSIAEDMALSPRKLDLFVWHKSVGLTILLLVGLRLAWRLYDGRPAPLTDSSRLENRLARVGHILLYLLMVAVPLSGWWIADTSRIPFRIYWQLPAPDFLPADKAASELAADAHGLLTALLLVVVALHVFAALRHHFLLGDATLLRMLKGRQAGNRDHV